MESAFLEVSWDEVVLGDEGHEGLSTEIVARIAGQNARVFQAFADLKRGESEEDARKRVKQC